MAKSIRATNQKRGAITRISAIATARCTRQCASSGSAQPVFWSLPIAIHELKDQKTGWALPLLAHCLVHLAVAMALILIIAPRFWFVAVIDFAIHIAVDRAKGLCSSTFCMTPERSEE